MRVFFKGEKRYEFDMRLHGNVIPASEAGTRLRIRVFCAPSEESFARSVAGEEGLRGGPSKPNSLP